MSQWQEQLMRALHSGDPAYMKAMLSHVPKDVLQSAVPVIAALAEDFAAKGELEQALVYFDQLVGIDSENAHWYVQRAKLQLRRGEFASALTDAEQASALDPEQWASLVLQGDALAATGQRDRALAVYAAASALAPEDEELARKLQSLTREMAPALPDVSFDPAIFEDPGGNGDSPAAMVEGVVRHLSRYSYHQSVRNAIDRLSDPSWISHWRSALADCAGSTVLFHGSELGVLALLALEAGATKVYIASTTPLEARISSGIVQKARLAQWREQSSARLEAMSQEEKQSSFDAFNVCIESVDPSAVNPPACDLLVFAPLDHSLLGSGVVPALQRWRSAGLTPRRVLPRRVQLFARGIEWQYPGSDYVLDPVGEFRWNIHAEPLEAADSCWRALTAVEAVGEVDLWEFEESVRTIPLSVISDGRLDAIAYWYRVDLGTAFLDSGPEGGLECLKPAVQYLDGAHVVVGESVASTLHTETTRFRWELETPRRKLRNARLASWYVSMMLDVVRNRAYRDALGKLPSEALVLELGAGCGLLSMMAVDAGSREVYGCEINRHICTMAERVVAANGYADHVHLINKDCRQLSVGEDLPRKADLVVFELFDCGLIGEGILHFLPRVREQLAAPEARYLPRGARLRAQIVEVRLDQIAGVDVNLLNPFNFTPGYMNVDASQLRYRALSEPFDLFEFDFATVTPDPQEIALRVEATHAGIAGAVLFWFDLQMDEHSWLSNAPQSEPAMHWNQALQYLPEMEVDADMPLALAAKHQGSALSFSWIDAEMPQRAVSRIPRVDPATWAQAMELESQTQQLLQHCRSEPEEYRRLAELAMRIAADPVGRGVDAKVAQRFASLFI